MLFVVQLVEHLLLAPYDLSSNPVIGNITWIVYFPLLTTKEKPKIRRKMPWIVRLVQKMHKTSILSPPSIPISCAAVANSVLLIYDSAQQTLIWTEKNPTSDSFRIKRSVGHSVTRWICFYSIFGHLQQWTFAESILIGPSRLKLFPTTKIALQ